LAGEKAHVICSLIHGVVNHLNIVKKLPHDVDTTFLDITQTTSVTKFNALLQTFSNMKLMGLMTTKSSVEEILELAGHVMLKSHWKGRGIDGITREKYYVTGDTLT
jgi:hypothetical protein